MGGFIRGWEDRMKESHGFTQGTKTLAYCLLDAYHAFGPIHPAGENRR